jgi:DNA-binding NarL/FixJ family response regulator
MRVMIVDDSRLYRLGLESLLAAWGETVVGAAADGEAGLQMSRHARPDVVFMDVNLPDMSGFEATQLIKAEMPKTRVVLITAHEVPQLDTRATGCGADGVLLKSMSNDDFRRLLMELRE